MNCREYRSGLIELGRGRTLGEASRQVLMGHLEVCAECARFLEAQCMLTAAMDHLTAEEIPSADQFAAPVMAEFDLLHPPRRRTRVVALRWAVVAGLAAAACLAVILTHRPAPMARAVVAAHPVTAATTVSTQPPRLSVPVKPATRVKQSASKPAAREPEEPFYPIPFTVPLGPGEWARVERMQIPVAALIAAGFHLPAMDPTATVEADVLVSQDGRARAIRPISISISD